MLLLPSLLVVDDARQEAPLDVEKVADRLPSMEA